MSDIVVTGLGWATPFGSDLKEVFDNLSSGATAIKKTQDIDLTDLYCQVSAQMGAYFPFEKWRKILPGNRASKFMFYGLEAAHQALLDAAILQDDQLHVDPNLKIGVIVGAGIGGLEEIYNNSKNLIEKGANRISPFFVPSALINLVAGHIAIRHQIKGPNQSQVAACGTGAYAIADGARMIKEGRCDIALVGAAEGSICQIGLAGFGALRALAAGYNETPEIASRPFDSKRSGFVMGEGAGILILESKAHALKRGARIYCEYLDAGLTNDAYHMTAPCADGAGAAAAMKEAVERSGLKTSDIDYINAHATSTPLGDKAELCAIKSVFANHWEKIAVSSIKGAFGHMLGAAGSVEAVACVLSLYYQKILPTINLQEADEEATLHGKLLDLVPNKGREQKLNYILSNSFGFGGHNISLVFGKG